MAVPPAAEIESMAYRDLQALCKENGLGARGKADELRAKLLEAASDSTDTGPPPVDPEDLVETTDDVDTSEAFDDALFDDIADTAPPPVEQEDLVETTDTVDTATGDFDDALFDDILAEIADDPSDSAYGADNLSDDPGEAREGN